MWERKADKAKWNGNVLNIQSTTLDGGKRLHVVELPYLDLPHIKVMGGKAKTISIEVVFVGPSSLDDANNTVLELESNPEGTLDHPWLGELDLVFETFTQSFSTKKGLVTLSLKFYRQGSLSNTTSVNTKTINTLVSDVNIRSKPLFINEINTATPNKISDMQSQFNNAFNSLRNIVNRSTKSTERLDLLHRQIDAGFSSTENIVSDPAAVPDSYFVIINSLNDVITEEENAANNNDVLSEKSTTTANELLPVRYLATQSINETINNDAESFHYKLHATSAVVLLSKDLKELNNIDEVSIETINGKSLDKMVKNIVVINAQLDDRVDDVSKEASFDSLALVDAVESLRENVREQDAKIIKFKHSLVEHDVPISRPIFCISQSLEADITQLNSLNIIKHPLFVRGKVQVTNA